MNRVIKALLLIALGAFLMYSFLWGKLLLWDLPNAWDKIYVPTNETREAQ